MAGFNDLTMIADSGLLFWATL